MYIKNSDKQRILKQRDESYRKFLIEESKRVEAKWDSFVENEDEPKRDEDKPPKESKKGKRKLPKVDVEECSEPQGEATTTEQPAVEDKEPVPVEVKAKKPKFKAVVKPEADTEPPKKRLKKKKNSPRENKKDEDTNPTEDSPVARTYMPFEEGNSKLLCLGCRESGHRLKHCPKFKTVVCIKCGSSDHKYRECKVGGGDFKHATCFVCKEVVSNNTN